MKKLLIGILAILSTLCFVFAGACADNSVKLVDFKNQEITVKFGSVYVAETVAIDEEGNEYQTTVTVTDNEGNAVEVFSNKFAVLKHGYTVVYKANINGKTYKKVDTLIVVSGNDPIIEVDETIKSVLLGEVYNFPTATAYDYFDGQINCTAKVYRASDDTEVQLADGENSYTATETGKYYVKYTAANSSQMTADAKVYFFVRAQAENGEWDNFDDEGAVYSTLYNETTVKSVSWLDTFEGRTGVLKISMNETDAYSSAFFLTPKVSDKSTYSGYNKLVLNIYFDGEEGTHSNFAMSHGNVVSLPITPKYGGWMTCVYDVTGIMNNWDKWFARNRVIDTTASNWQNSFFYGTYLKPCDIYIDNLYFANEITSLDGNIVEENGVVTMDYSAEGATLGYSVKFDDKWVEVNGNTFNAEYVGNYTIIPHVINSNEYVYTGAPIIYQSVGENQITLNNYDTVIPLNATAGSYVLPQATVTNESGNAVSGYDLKVKTVYRGYNNVIDNREFSTDNKGSYEYIITAEKDGEKTLYANARIKVGDYITGEVFNVNDADAAERVGTMLMGSTQSVVDGQEIDQSYAGSKYLKMAVDLNSNYLSTGYMNFRPSATPNEVNDRLYDLIKVKFYVKATLKEGVTESVTTIKFLGGTETQLKYNEWTEINVSPLAFESRYPKLCEDATWNDVAATFKIPYADFNTFAIYMSDITAEVDEMPTNLIIVDENTANRIYNNAISSVYVSAQEITGITGDYKGNAVKFTYGSNNSGYAVNMNMSTRMLDDFCSYYESVTMNVAVKAPDEMKQYYMSLTPTSNGSLVGVANGGQYVVSGAKYNTWITLTMSAKDFVEFVKGKTSALLFGTYVETSHPKFDREIYVGDITFNEIPADENPKYDNEGSDIDWNNQRN